MFTASLVIFVFGLVASLAGGYLGAAIGGNYGFVFTGFAILMAWGIFAGTKSTIGFDWVAFGPFAGPHICFAAGVAAAAYAANRGYTVPSAAMEITSDEVHEGRDASEPLARLGKPDVLYVGAAFGAFGYLCQLALAQIPWLSSHTDTVALTVVLSAVLARVMFGGGSLINPEKFNKASGFWGKIAPNANDHWLRYQERPSQYLPIGFFFGILAGSVAIAIAHVVPGSAGLANTLPFAFSAIVILFLIMGHGMPVQHHVTNIAGLAAVMFFPIFMGKNIKTFDWQGTWTDQTWTMALVAVIVAGVVGAFMAFLGEFQSRVWHQRGTTHFDPPANAIWVGNMLVVTVAGLLAIG